MGDGKQQLGFIGLGTMGSGIARNLLAAGFEVTGFDIRREALTALEEAGGKAADSIEEVVASCDVVITCLVSTSYLEIAPQILVPNARPGQLFIDHSTLPPPDARHIGKRFVAQGARIIDAPVSGGEGGAAKGVLSIFVGGELETVETSMPYLRAVGNPERIFHCGPSGMGQVGKVVQQMKDRLVDAVRLEILSYGVRGGLELSQVLDILNVDPDSNDGFAKLYQGIVAGEGEQLGCLFTEWRYFLAESKSRGFTMPMLEGMYEFWQWGDRVFVDIVHRPGPSVWRELMKDSPED